MGSMEALVVCSGKNMSIGITIWDLENADRLLHIPTCASPTNGLICLRNQYLVASQVQRTGSVSGGVIFKWPLNKHQAILRSYLMEAIGPLSCTKDGIYLSCGATSGNIYIWEVTSGRLLRKWPAHHKSINCIEFSKDDSFLISGSQDGTIAVWPMIGLLDEQNGGCMPYILSFSAEHKGAITGLLSTSSNSNCNFISSSLDGTCKIWDVVTGKLLMTQEYPSPITAVVLDALEIILFSGSANGSIFLNNFDAGLDDPFPKPDGAQVVLDGHKKSITALTFCGLGLISASDDCTVCLWDIANCAIIRRFHHFKGPVTNLVVISKSSLIVPWKNNQKGSTQFRISLLDKYSQPPNLAKEALTLLPSYVDAQEKKETNSGYRSMELLKMQILDLETERTTAALQMKVETNIANQMWVTNMTKNTMKINNNLQSSYLDLLHARLLQHPEPRLKMDNNSKMIEDDELALK